MRFRAFFLKFYKHLRNANSSIPFVGLFGKVLFGCSLTWTRLVYNLYDLNTVQARIEVLGAPDIPWYQN